MIFYFYWQLADSNYDEYATPGTTTLYRKFEPTAYLLMHALDLDEKSIKRRLDELNKQWIFA